MAISKHRYPEIFYYAETSSAQSFNSNPPGSLNLSRLIEGKKAFESPVPARQLKPKKLILADWRAKHWSREKIEAVQDQLKKMMREADDAEAGFEIYRWDKDKSVPLSANDLSGSLWNFNLRASMAPTQHARLKESLMERGISQDKVFVLDSYWLDCLLQDNFTLEHVVYTKDFDSVNHAVQLREYLTSMQPPPACLIHEHGASKEFDVHVNVFETILDCPLSVTLRHLLYMEDELLNALLEGALFALLPNLEQMNFSESDISAENLFRLLQHTPNLKALNLRRCQNLRNASELIPGPLPGIEGINLSYSQVSSENLFKLLQDAPNLKELNLRQCQTLNDFSERIPGPLPGIERIDLSFSCISSKNLFRLLQQTPNLKELDLGATQKLSDRSDRIQNNFLGLECIKLSESDLSSENLLKLLQASPNLKKFELGCSENLRVIFETISGHLPPAIEEVDFSGGRIFYDDLLVFLRELPNLKKLELSFATNLSVISETMNGDRSLGLEALNLSGSDISYKNLARFLQQIPKLKKLELRHSENLGDCDEIIDGSLLLDLEEINLSESQIASKNLLNLLQQTPNLKRLDLGYAQNPGNLFEILPGHLPPGLEEINLSYSHLSSENLLNLVRRAPNLSKLNIMACQSLDLNHPILEDLLKKIPFVSFKATQNQGRASPSHEVLSFHEESDSCHDASAPTAKIDADTREIQGKSFSVNQIFYSTNHGRPRNVTFVRMGAYNRLFINQSPTQLEDAFILERGDDLQLEPRAIQVCREDVFVKARDLNKKGKRKWMYYYGKQSFDLKDDWQPIASLSPDETLTHYHVSPEGASVALQYSNACNQYFIKSNSGAQAMTLDFAVRVPFQKKNLLPQRIEKRVQDYMEFGSGALHLDVSNPTGEDYLAAIIQQKRGACRHRALAFKSEMDEAGIPCRIVMNECHAFVELWHESQWHMINLGGYAATLTIDDSSRPRLPGASEQPSAARQVIFDGQSDESDLFSAYLDAFATWEQPSEEANSALGYVAHCLNPDVQKRLIECRSGDALHALRAMIQLHSTRPVFYINEPDELVCAASYLTRTHENQGCIHKGPGGPLYDFFQRHADGTLLVNYSAFEADEIVRTHTLLDNPPSIDGVPIPMTMNLIGLMNLSKPECYQGSDFYSRFEGHVEHCPLTKEDFLAEEPRLFRAHAALEKAATQSSAQSPRVIHLFHASDWRERLLGRWVLDGARLDYQAGALVDLSPGQPLEIMNGLWDDAAFRQFWVDIQSVGIAHPAGTENGVESAPFLLADNPIQRVEGYDWPLLLSNLTLVTDKAPDAIVCNPTLLPECLSRHEIRDGLFYKQPGWIEQAQSGVLSLHLTRRLNEDEWGMLLVNAHVHGISIRASISKGVELPEIFRAHLDSSNAEEWTEERIDQSASQASSVVIISTDPSTTVQQLTHGQETWEVFDISECDPSDLLVETLAMFNQAHGDFYFKEETRYLPKALDADKNILLKGRFSDALKDRLAPFLFLREQQSAVSGRLILLTDNAEDFSEMGARSYHEVTPHEKAALLGLGVDEEHHDYLDALSAYLDAEPFSKLRARLRYLKAQVAEGGRLEALNSEDAWIGLSRLPKLCEETERFSFETARDKAREFMETRLTRVKQALHSAPYVFLSGPTGSGKTTFVMQTFGQDSKETLYIGVESLKAWATDDGGQGNKVLFVDEANLTDKDWTQFDGLLQQTPFILIEGHAYALSRRHQVIFAGNPVSYGDERKLPRLFAAHGSALYFEPLPKAALYETVLKPIFENTGLPQEFIEKISDRLLKLYDFIKPLSQSDVLISPRALQAMALLSHAAITIKTDEYGASSSAPSIDEAALQRMIWRDARQWIPKAHQFAFDAAFKPVAVEAPRFEVRDDFIVTPSRQSLIQQMDEWLRLREWRIEQQASLNDAQLYGGLGGFVIEGAPGIGKSDLVMKNLIHHGYAEGRDLARSAKGNWFYRIPASLSLSEKEQRLRKAFHEGAVAIMDEVNSSPMMERLMNCLLMGRTPEGERPKIPGFVVIGTQNPASMAGRRKASHALAHRMNQIALDPYQEDELTAILAQKGVETNLAKAMAKAFLIQSRAAIRNHHQPEPTFRDLLAQVKPLQATRELFVSGPEKINPDNRYSFFKQKQAALPKDPGAELPCHCLIL